MSQSREWWQAVAKMSRAELVDELETTRESNNDLRSRVPGKPVFIAGDYNNAKISTSKMGLGPNEYIAIITSSYSGNTMHSLRGFRLDPRNTYAVPGWRYMGIDRVVEEIEVMLAQSGIDWQDLAYGPSPEFERCESELDRYGRFYKERADRLQRELDELRTSEKVTETYENSFDDTLDIYFGTK